MSDLWLSVLIGGAVALILLSIFAARQYAENRRKTRPQPGTATKPNVLRWFEYYAHLFDEDTADPVLGSCCAGLLTDAFKKELPTIEEEPGKDAEQVAVRHIYRLTYAELAAGHHFDGVGAAPALSRVMEKSAAWLKERGLLSSEQADNDSALMLELRRDA